MSGVRNTIYAPHLIVCIGNRWSVTEIPLFVNTPVLVIKCVPTCFHRLFFSSPFLTAHPFPQTPPTAASPEPPHKPIPKPRNTNAATHHLQQEAPQTESGIQTETPDLVVRGASHRQEALIAHQEMPPPIN